MSRTYHPSNGNFGPNTQKGITLREHYAGLALPAAITVIDSVPGRAVNASKQEIAAAVARIAVRMADALITELEKPSS